MGCGYMPNGVRTYVDDREESGVRTRKQRKDKKKCGIGHHDGDNAQVVHVVEIVLFKCSVIGMQHTPSEERQRPNTRLLALWNGNSAWTARHHTPRHMLESHMCRAKLSGLLVPTWQRDYAIL